MEKVRRSTPSLAERWPSGLSSVSIWKSEANRWLMPESQERALESLYHKDVSYDLASDS